MLSNLSAHAQMGFGMPLVKSLSVSNGDMYYINHGSDNFTVIDCCLSDDNRERITREIDELALEKGITRFISTHPDEDYIQGIKYFDDKVGIANFYCVENEATKDEVTESFKHYRRLRDSSKAYYIKQGCIRRWMNRKSDERGPSGINVLWPKRSNADFKTALEDAKAGVAFNNISAVVRYRVTDSVDALAERPRNVVHGGDRERHNLAENEHRFGRPSWPTSGKIRNSWLDKLEPEIIVIGEAPERHLHHYKGYEIITQNEAWDITFDLCDDNKVHVYVDNPDYEPEGDFLADEGQTAFDNYIGTLNI